MDRYKVLIRGKQTTSPPRDRNVLAENFEEEGPFTVFYVKRAGGEKQKVLAVRTDDIIEIEWDPDPPR